MQEVVNILPLVTWGIGVSPAAAASRHTLRTAAPRASTHRCHSRWPHRLLSPTSCCMVSHTWCLFC